MNFAGTPQFCAIAPINCSNLVSGRKAHLVLAHLLDVNHWSDPVKKQLALDYMAFVRAESDAGAFVMCDNSAYELKEPYSPEKLIEIGTACGAHAIVLPDYPFKKSSYTIEAAELYAQQYKDAGFKTFFVPQSETGDIDDWKAAYKWASENPLIDIIGISILGVPNAWSDIAPAFARVVAMNELVATGLFDASKHHHFLGLNSGPALEIPSLLRMGVLDTVDSSGPVWAAINGHSYTRESDSYQQVCKLTNPVDFHMHYPKDMKTVDRVLYNMALTDQLFSPDEYNAATKWYAEE